MQNNESIFDASSLTTKEIINRLILLGEDIYSQNQTRQYYLDLYQNIINSNPANIEILKRYISNKRELTDSVLSKKRARDDEDNEEVDDITKMQNFCNSDTRMTYSQNKYQARTFNDLHLLNYPSINVKIEMAKDTGVESDNKNKNNIQSNNKSMLQRSNSYSYSNNQITYSVEKEIPQPSFNRTNSHTPIRFGKSPSHIRSANRSATKLTVRQHAKPEKLKTAYTLNINNLLGAAGLMGISGVAYVSYKQSEKINEVLELSIKTISELINQNGPLVYTLLGIFGFVVLVLILNKIKNALDEKLEKIARKIINEAEKNLKSLSNSGMTDSMDSEAFVDDFCRQNNIWLMKSCIMNEITRLLNNREEKLEEKVTKKTWMLK